MKKLVVCGDSFASASVLTPGKHYSEIIADRMGYELVSLARGGMSNLGICLQIEYAIRMQADFVIISVTDSSRIEIPFNSAGFNFVSDDDVYTVDYNQLSRNIRTGFDPCRGLENIVYDHKNYLSCTNKFLNHNPTMRSDNLSSLMCGEYYPVSKKQKIAMQYYLTELFDVNWKAQVDRWCVGYCVGQLIKSSIPFVIKPDSLLPPDGFLSKNSVVFNWMDYTRACNTPGWSDPGYHTDDAAQVEIADIFYNKVLQVLNESNS